ncbi:MAG: hypothetical protein ACXADX_16425 [Candidatus Hodarchaeales archaeon]|jgi:hypothetical protein
MKKLAVSMGVATLFLLALAQFTPAAAVTLMDITGYSLENEKFAVTMDMNQDFYGILTGGSPNAARIELSGDLLNPSNAKIAPTDTYAKDDQEFYMAYANMDGIQAAYSALMKFEHNVSAAEVLNTFWDDIGLSGLDLVKSQILNHASGYHVGYINATAPFQNLVEHWRTAPNPTTAVQYDMTVANSYAALVAYSSTAEDQELDSNDKLYLGYTFAFNYFKDAVNSFIEDNTDEGPNFVPDYTAKPFFETLANGYKFGIEYTNLFVIWQEINAQRFEDNRGIIYGNDIVAASLLDSLTFTYTFTTTSLGTSPVAPGIEIIHADIQTEYDFGETNLLVVQESAAPGAGPWTDTFSTSDDYVFDLPQAFLDVVNAIPTVSNFPTAITVPLPDLTFYLNDDAKRRIGYSEGGYGMTMVTMTNAFAVGMTPAHPDAAGEITDTIDILANGEKAFATTFTDKLDYTLSGLPADMTGNGAHTAIIDYFPAGNTYIQNLGTFYFKLEVGFAKAFLYLLALEMGLDNAADQGRIVDVAHHAYVTLTEYPAWNGGAIDHDPTYTAISGQGEGGTGSESEEDSSAGAFAPGFEFLTVFLAAIPLVLYKKRK